MHPVFPGTFIRQSPQLGGDVGLAYDDVVIVQILSVGRHQNLPPHQRDLDRQIPGGVIPHFSHLPDQGQQKGGRSEIAVDFQLHHGPDLNFRISDPGGNHHTADASARLVQEDPRGGQMVGKGVHDEVPGTKTHIVEAFSQPPVILFPPLRVIERTGRNVDPLEAFHRNGEKPPERRVLPVTFRHLVLFQHGDLRKIIDRSDGRRRYAPFIEKLPVTGRLFISVAQTSQRRLLLEDGAGRPIHCLDLFVIISNVSLFRPSSRHRQSPLRLMRIHYSVDTDCFFIYFHR